MDAENINFRLSQFINKKKSSENKKKTRLKLIEYLVNNKKFS